MRYVDEYRAPEQVLQLIGHLKTRAALLEYTAENPLRIMEVCGGHTHAIFKFGLDQLLPENIEFIHGPGCPVCVLPMGRIDSCIEIASQPDVIFCTFGDAMRVPGKNGSLLQAKARGADIRIVYSPMDALTLAELQAFAARMQTLAMASTPLNDPADAKTEDGYAFEYSFGTIYADSPAMSIDTQLLSIVLTSAEERGPRDIQVGDELSIVLEANYSENPSLRGSRESAVLYVLDLLPESMRWG